MYPVLTYSRTPGDFTHDLAALHALGLRAIRLIYKGLPEASFLQRITELNEQIGRQNLEMDILVDLPGRKPMIGDVQQGVAIEAGKIYRLAEQAPGLALPVLPTAGFFDHPGFPDLSPGDVISIADDELNMEIRELTGTEVICEALNSFQLTSNRSLNIRNKPFPMTANSEKDLLLVQHLKDIPANVKFVVSFTRDAGDILKLKALQPAADVIPKIETLVGDTELHNILACCQTLMLGRGDLSLECRPNELFAFQQHLIGLCRAQGKQLIVGTGLLGGIADKGAPGIAELTDYGYLRHAGVEAFLITGTNAHHYPTRTLEFMRDFEK